MADDIFSLLKPGEANMLALKRELESRIARWDHPGYFYRGGADMIQKHGRLYAGRQLPDQYVHHYGEPNNCFYNAMLAAQADPDLRYCEGLYAAHGAFTPHAWCVDPAGEVVEVTWPTRPEHGSEQGRDHIMRMRIVHPERMAYGGVIFHPDLIEWFLDKYDEFCLFDRPAADLDPGLRGTTLLDMGQSHDWPILKVPYDSDRTSL
jgi:hypothetical protein